ncbi:MAG: polysaccharide deacetylase family protein, partial [Candidatus Goldbacteria bacterium]|nr:polysaccharide deacetylase family protein [Candidatus Goldiibacteriota bacterium]
MNIPILLYHKIVNDHEKTDDNFSISISTFKNHIEYLKNKNYVTISLNELLNYLFSKTKLPKNCIIITFDDSYKNILTLAKPILDNVGFKATVFVVSKSIGLYNFWDNPDEQRKEPCLDKDELLSLIKSGWDIGSHSLTHAHFFKITEDKIIKEIYGSKFDLEQTLKTDILSFAYPFGEYNNKIREFVIKAGYKLGFSIISPALTVTGDPFLIRRILIKKSDSFEDFKRKIS